MLMVPQGPDVQAEGQTDEKPLVLDGTSKVDFMGAAQNLVSTADPQNRFHVQRRVAFCAEVIDAARDLAMRSLTTVTTQSSRTPSASFTQQYDVATWLRDGYTSLAERSDIIFEEEAQKLRWRTAFRLSQVREKRNGGTLDWGTMCLQSRREAL
ncbi:hypothetical protein K438DRAFT_1953833 [Mycena galopus ATCC 62051]|nr:hypothetical protein K438DRAFT_1953833 [Mycena galopus ATCC 62051]